MKRRTFLKNSTLALGTASAVGGVWTETRAEESKSSLEKMNLLCVGTSNRAANNIQAVADENIIGLCDVDQRFLDKAKARFTSASLYRDYREMIAAEADKADGIVIATADHQHAPAAIRAINAGLHCYCEKPLTHTVAEARMIAEAAKKQGLVTQMGTQIHAGNNYRRVVEVIQSGGIGEVSEVVVWVGKGWGGGDRPADSDPVPAELDWDLWLGPAPERPYKEGRYHPAQWRRWWDFGQGTLGDMGCHYIDLPFWALDLRHPTTVTAEGPDVHAETCPLGLTVTYEFPANHSRGDIKLTWHDGQNIPTEVAGEKVKGNGIMFIGSEGKLLSTYSGYQIFPKEKFRKYVPPEPSIPNSIGHHREWIEACKHGGMTTCNFDYSGALTEAVLLGNVAFRTCKTLQWDAESLSATNCPEADRFIRKTYRKDWEVTPTTV